MKTASVSATGAAVATPQVFRSNEVCQFAGVSLRQLQWWDERGILSPEKEFHGSGSVRQYTEHQRLLARIIRELGDKGIRPSKCAGGMRTLRLLGGPYLLATRGGRFIWLNSAANVIRRLEMSTGAMVLVCVPELAQPGAES